RLHGAVARAVAERFTAAGASVAAPQPAFYRCPDFEAHRERLAADHGVGTGPELCGLLLERYGMGVLPAVEFGESAEALRMRVATSLLYGETEAERYAALAVDDPTRLPWIQAHLDPVAEVLAGVAAPLAAAARAAPGPSGGRPGADPDAGDRSSRQRRSR